MQPLQLTTDIPLAILILAKEFVNSKTGITHFTLTISINHSPCYKLPITVGHGNHFVDAAAWWLNEKKIVTLKNQNLQQSCDNTGISLTTSMIKVNNFDDL